MDLSWDDRRTRQFVTNVGLITSDGPHGPNIMSAEWTHYLSYEPALMAVCIAPSHASHDNIAQNKAFGLNLASVNQTMLASVAGGNTGKEIDKFPVLEALGFTFYPAEHIDVLMVKDAAMNAECKVVKQLELGDHTMFVGEIQSIDADPSIKPLVYHNGKFWRVGEHIEKPNKTTLDTIKKLVEEHTK